MQTYSIFKYQLAAYRKGLLIYYLVMIGLLLVSALGTLPFMITSGQGGGTTIQMNGNSTVTFIFFLVVGISDFRENFNMALQNGVSRKSLLLGRIGAAAVLSLIAAAIDVLTLVPIRLLNLFPGVRAVSNDLLATFYPRLIQGVFPLWSALGSVALAFCLLLAFFGIGHLVGVILYRLGKLGKTIFWIAVTAVPMILGPGLYELWSRFPGWAVWNVLRSFGIVVVRLAATPWSLGLTGVVIFAVLMALSWLPMRKAQVKRT